MPKQDSKRIIVTDKADSVIGQLFKKYNLEEDPKQYIDKIKKNESPNDVLIVKVAKKIADNSVSEKEAAAVFQKNCGLAADKANQLAREIKSSAVPFIEIISEENLVKRLKEELAQSKKTGVAQTETKNGISPKKTPPIAEKILPKPTAQKQNSVKKDDFLKFPPEKKQALPAKEEKKLEQPPKRPAGSDSYIEPIG